MSIYQLKTQFQNQLRPISNRLVQSHITANQVTISAVVLSASMAYVVVKMADNTSQSHRMGWFVLPIGLFMRMAMNAIDGMMAREHGQASTLGAVLNEVGDIVSDGMLIASLYPHALQSSPHDVQYHHMHFSRLLQLTVSTELIAIASHLLTSQRANHGPLGKSDRAFELGVIGVLAGLGVSLSAYIQHLYWLNELLLLKTCFNRLQFIAKQYFDKLHPAPALNDTALNIIGVNNSPATLPIVPTAPTAMIRATTDIPLMNPYSHIFGNTMKTSNDTTLNDTKSTEQAKPIIEAQSCFNAYDGTAIYYRYWLTMPLADIKAHSSQLDMNQSDSKQSDTKQSNTHTLRQVILLHRGHEHSGRLQQLAMQFAQSGYQVFAWDARGNGRSGGIKDHAESVTQLERDFDDFVRRIVIAQTGIGLEDTLIVASSIGAVLAGAWVHDYAPKIRGMILATPAFSIRLYVPLAIPALKVARKLGIMSRVSSYVKAQVLTHDKTAQQAYNDDPLISGSISSDLLIDTHATGQRLLADASAITTPTFILCAGKDYVVDKQAEREFYDNLATPHKRWKLYPDSFHAIFHETNKTDVFADCLEFANELFNQPVSSVDLTTAHLDSASKDKVDRLAIKPFNPNFAITRFAMHKFGHISDAIATGLEHGFDSGGSLEKVYANQPKGKNSIGRLIDGFYLNNIGWQGIRIRREHLLELARIAIHHRLAVKEQLTAKNKNDDSIALLDIASGHGHYVFELLAEFEQLNAQLRDYESHNVTALSDKAQQQQLTERVKVVQKDAFDKNSYHDKPQDNQAFDLAIASGVFELFSDNRLIQTALSGIYDSLKAEGYFIYTNQPWHPEQEFIAKTLNNHQGTQWIMRCRSQAEIDQLVEQAGFCKVDMRIDRFGIFTVSLAIKQSDK